MNLWKTKLPNFQTFHELFISYPTFNSSRVSSQPLTTAPVLHAPLPFRSSAALPATVHRDWQLMRQLVCSSPLIFKLRPHLSALPRIVPCTCCKLLVLGVL